MTLACRFKIFLVCLWFPIPLLAANSAPHQLADVLNRFHGMRAHFVQTVVDERGQVLQKTTGQMVLQRPGRFRWQIDQPNKQLLIANGDRTWFYDIGLQQIVIQKQPVLLASSPVALLSDAPKNLTRHFDITFFKDTQSFYLLPTDKNTWFRSVILLFHEDQLREMRLSDKLGQQTVIHFSQVELDFPVSDLLFHFVLPKNKNIEIIKG